MMAANTNGQQDTSESKIDMKQTLAKANGQHDTSRSKINIQKLII